MTLQQLQYFVAACRHGNISYAAREFDVSQPSVSIAIRNLEREFGVSLIQRQSHGFSLTEAGTDFLSLADSLLEHTDQISRIMRERGKGRHLLRLGMPPMAASLLFPALYSDFCAKHPDIEILTDEMGREDLLRALDSGLLDLSFIPHTETSMPDYTVIPVRRFETVCCVPAGHPLSDKTAIDPFDLTETPLVMFPRSFLQTGRILDAFTRARTEPHILCTSSQLSTLEELILSGTAVGFLFREIAEKNTRIVPISLSPPLYTDISLIYPKDAYMSHGMKLFTEYIRNFSASRREFTSAYGAQRNPSES